MSTIDPERLLPDSTAEQLAAEFRDAQEYFRTGTTKALRWRAEQLRAAKKMVTENGDAIVAALNKDLRRPR